MIRFHKIGPAALLLTALAAVACVSPGGNTHDETGTRLSAVGSSDKLTFTGIVQSAGLSAKEKDSFNLQSDFQLLTSSGSWFLEGPLNFLDQWGKCVTVFGEVKENWDGDSKPWAYERSALTVDSIKKLPYDECRGENGPEAGAAVRYPDSEKETLRGFLIRSKRPAPDIAYDYSLKLTTPYIIQEHPVAGGDLEVESIPIIPSDFEMQADLENYLEKDIEVSVQGAVVSGYAESTVVQLSTVKPAMQL